MTTPWRIINGDCLEAMATMPASSVDAVVTDPPYGLGFMGKQWDGLPPGVPWARQCLRVLKPGGHLLAFGGTRTSHRLACAIEDAGFEIRDTIAWMYGSGFPKSLNLNGDWQGWGTALKPAHEPIVVARKPLAGTVARNVLSHGTGALNIDACRIDGDANDPNVRAHKTRPGTDKFAGVPYGDGLGGNGEGWNPALGRWPANVALDPDAAAILDQQTGEQTSGVAVRRNVAGKPIKDQSLYGGGWRHPDEDLGYGDTGGASRFFYVAKASSAERNAGLDGFEERDMAEVFNRGLAGASIPLKGSPAPKYRNTHPTVKPIELMRWLVRLVTPLGGTVLDPFTGSGTTGIACLLEGFRFTGIEQDPDYVRIARARLAWWSSHPDGMTLVRRLEAEQERQTIADSGQLALEVP